MNTSTPRTDAAELTEPYEIRALGFCVVNIDDARQLERELTEAREQRDTLAEALKTADVCLALFEDTAHGELGEMTTKTRKIIATLKL
jgi:hypothetical protein